MDKQEIRLIDILRDKISKNGPINVGAFMDLCLSHPEHGYYMKKDPFGARGDFVTAPEVSQIFGEMLGAWVADIWHQLGSPEAFTLLECGPGRGTLMADILRATRGVEGFHSALDLRLMEISPVLKSMQEEKLSLYEPQWIEGIDEIPQGQALIVIGNEFLDALPFRSYQKTRSGWAERCVDVKDSELVFTLLDEETAPNCIPFHLRDVKVGSVFEYSEVRNEFFRNLSRILADQGGAGLFIDYGHEKTAVGDTFQAIKDNSYSSVLNDIGDADLTSHVDFEMLVHNAIREVRVHGPVTQGDFLKNLGIEIRAQMLIRHGGEKHEAQIKKDLHRLVASSEMGALFKVICMCGKNEPELKPAGM
ncbi:MAG: hypothetical protein CBB87_11295 [Micavibrio sp. TMED27]|nr:SAM-dependent methyltransferase [Micavibrio sp.]OUT89878.1 MAG: hypothetical protein CBB87_11295 [Micavibrio sp. TMED27]